ncbi:MAG: hypothetical protein ACXAC8_19690 [Candidatus Hodarchaeales archaeon]|jgi:hypothetical protein
MFKSFLILIVIFLGLSFTTYPLPVEGAAIYNETSLFQSHSISEPSLSGKFYFENSSVLNSIFRLLYYTAVRIGEKYNVSFSLDSNSTTDVRITCYISPNLWEGPTEMNLQPSETKSHIYISHVCGDNLDTISPVFKLLLMNSTAKVSGHYKAVLLFAGYQHPSCGTGQAVVENITHWLVDISSSNKTTSYVTRDFLIYVFLGPILIALQRKRHPLRRRKTPILIRSRRIF